MENLVSERGLRRSPGEEISIQKNRSYEHLNEFPEEKSLKQRLKEALNTCLMVIIGICLFIILIDFLGHSMLNSMNS